MRDANDAAKTGVGVRRLRTCESSLRRVLRLVLEPDAWGLCDMQGNVWEWCWDWYADLEPPEVVDPLGPESGTKKVVRGGGWTTTGPCRVAMRSPNAPKVQAEILGFRVARSLVRQTGD